jgi:hypothetical protein
MFIGTFMNLLKRYFERKFPLIFPRFTLNKFILSGELIWTNFAIRKRAKESQKGK